MHTHTQIALQTRSGGKDTLKKLRATRKAGFQAEREFFLWPANPRIWGYNGPLIDPILTSGLQVSSL